MNNEQANPLNLTKVAVEKITELVEQEKLHDQVLRVGIVGEDCHGFMYTFDFTEDINHDNDYLFQVDTLKLAIDKDSMANLKGATIDYVEGTGGMGFKFDNPNQSSKQCGNCECGKDC